MAKENDTRPALRREILLAFGIDCPDAQSHPATPAPHGAILSGPIEEDDFEFARRTA